MTLGNTKMRRRRGMAMLLVMIALVVCLILVAGFLNTQATATGIAHNERNYQECKSLAQSGIDVCVWQMKNRPDWREVMPIGNWLANQSIGGGTVTVSVADATNSFTDDNTQSVTMTSTATANGRTCTLVAIVGPTGGGTVFGNGSFAAGQVVIGNSLLSSCTFDSYDSSLGAYSSSNPGASALLNINSSTNGALTINGLSSFNGSAVFPPGSVLGNVVNLLLGALTGPSSKSTATETRTLGTVIPPNTTGLPNRAAINQFFNQTYSSGAIYPSITVNTTNPVTTLTIGTTGTYYVTGNLNVNSNSVLQVSDGATVTIRVDGNVNIAGSVRLNNTGQLTIVANGNVNVSGNVNWNGANSTSAFLLEGLNGGGNINLSSNAVVMGGIYAPKSTLNMSNSAALYGAAAVNAISMQNSSAVHWDNAMKSRLVHNLYNGSAAPGGTVDYTIQYQTTN